MSAVRASVAALCVFTTLAGCSGGPTRHAESPTATRVTTPGQGSPPTTPSDTGSPLTTEPSTPAPDSSAPGTTSAPPPGSALPRGGRAILGTYRVVAYYGGPTGPALGVLGSGPPDRIAEQIERRARAFATYGRPVLPTMELIATVAQGAPGRDGMYSKPIAPAVIARYLAAAHRHHMLLVLDFQPGRGDFLRQVQAVAPFLADPSVSVALDPEWKMAPGQVPGRVIGSSSAAGINAVSRYLAGVVAKNHLPDKLLLVHQFTRAMLPDRWRITRPAGIEVVFHADGFGTRRAKLETWRRLAFPGRPFGTGLKLFLRQDTGMMTPAQAMALRPLPDVITYQ
jgi:hypothetical protein